MTDDRVIADECDRAAAHTSGRFGVMPADWRGFWWVASRSWWSPIVTLTRYGGSREMNAPTGDRRRISILRFWRLCREVDRARNPSLPTARINTAPRGRMEK